MDNYFSPGTSDAFCCGARSLQGNDAFNNRQITGTVGAGDGRVRNVTPTVVAIRIVEDLRSTGQISGAPTLAVYQRMANIGDWEPEYRSRHGVQDYESFWVNDIAKVLQDSGVMVGDLQAGQVIRAFDVLTRERISTRKVGWKVRAGVGYVFSSFDGDGTSDPALEVGAEYHFPFSNQTQFSNEAIFTTILNDEDESYAFNNLMTLTYEIGSKLDWENAWRLGHAHDGPTQTERTSNTLSTSLIYEINNVFDLTTTLAATNYSVDVNGLVANGTDTSLFVGARYRLK